MSKNLVFRGTSSVKKLTPSWETRSASFKSAAMAPYHTRGVTLAFRGVRVETTRPSDLANDFDTGHVRFENLRYTDRAVRLLVVFQNRDEGATYCQT
jgi:hypothetical protein